MQCCTVLFQMAQRRSVASHLVVCALDVLVGIPPWCVRAGISSTYIKCGEQVVQLLVNMCAAVAGRFFNQHIGNSTRMRGPTHINGIAPSKSPLRGHV